MLQCARAVGWPDYRIPEFRRGRIKACYCYRLAVGLLALGSWTYVIFVLPCLVFWLVFFLWVFFSQIFLYVAGLFWVWRGTFGLCTFLLVFFFFFSCSGGLCCILCLRTTICGLICLTRCKKLHWMVRTGGVEIHFLAAYPDPDPSRPGAATSSTRA